MKHAIKHIHYVGLGGAGMSGIAELLRNLGYTISGSDLSDSAALKRLAPFGIKTLVGHDAKNIAGADADVIVCRAGASTVTEIAAVGCAAVFVPFPAAVDDHQTTNAKFLVDAGGGWLVQQRDLTPEWLAGLLRTVDRNELIRRAEAAKTMQKTTATEEVVAACEELVKR